MFKALPSSLLSVIFPQDCHVCKGLADDPEDPDACGDCWSETKFFDGDEMLCDRCGAVLGLSPAPQAVYCRKCDDHQFNRAFALGVYEKALAAAIAHLKREPFLSPKLRARLLAVLPHITDIHPDVIIPVPLSNRRRIERGFNQAETIAAYLSMLTSIPADLGSLTRAVDTPMHRVGMDQKARELTVKKAFSITRPSLISGKRILLVDDVLTSGATTSACATALKKTGGKCVRFHTCPRRYALNPGRRLFQSEEICVRQFGVYRLNPGRKAVTL